MPIIALPERSRHLPGYRRVGAGGQVLPAGVGDHEGDVGALTGPACRLADSQRGVQHRARRDAGEDPFGVHQLAGAAHGVGRADRVPGGQHLRVVQFGHEPLIDVAQRIDPLAVAGFGGHDLDAGHTLTQKSPGTHQRARGAQAGDEMGDLGQVGEQFGAGAVVMRVGVGRIAVLVQHHPRRVGRGQFLGFGHRGVGPALGRREDDPRAVELQQLTPFHRGVLGHHADQLIALQTGGHRQRNAGVAAGGLEDRRARRQQAVPLGLLDHPQRRPVLDRAGRVAVLELGPQPHMRLVIPARR